VQLKLDSLAWRNYCDAMDENRGARDENNGDAAGVSESAARAALDLRVAFNRLRRRIREVSETEDLTPSQLSALTLLSKSGAATTSGLAATEGVRPQSMAATLAALDQHGLIARSPDPGDGRRQLVTLTEAGRERVEGTRQARQEWLAQALHDRCTEAERQTVIEAMAVLERLTRP
jgi:DNA-binding MarR family transcriptional regulator